MTFLATAATSPTFAYAGEEATLLVGGGALPEGFAMARQTIPAGFRGPIPHAHDTFDEALYVLDGVLTVLTEEGEREAGPGELMVAPRGQRHGFRNPAAAAVTVLGLWSPAALGVAFMREIGALLTAQGAPDPDAVRDAYARHGSRLLPQA